MIRQSEYTVIEQLNHMPARISLLALLMNFEPHRRALLKILNEAHVVHNLSVEKFKGIASNITANNFLTFADHEIPEEGVGHNKALHISVKCMDHILARVLIDNSSSLNVMPKITLSKLPFGNSQLRASSMVVKAFDGSWRKVIGEIDLLVQIGPTIFNVTFQVMDILPAYSCLLGRPWIHSARAVPSTVHRKLKFITNDRLIIVSVEEDFLVSEPTNPPYIEAAEEALETHFQALEIANVTTIKEGEVVDQPRPPKVLLMMAKIMLRSGFKPGDKLGQNEEGLIRPLQLNKNKSRYGLGYKPTEDDKKGQKRVPLRHISESFRSAGYETPDFVAMLDRGKMMPNIDDLVTACPPGQELSNWETIELSMTFNLVSM